MIVAGRLPGHTGGVELLAELDAPCSPTELFSWVDDLDRYQQWLGLVRRTEAVAPAVAGGDPAWHVDLRAQLGPLSRAKRLRMERTVHDDTGEVLVAVFERRELDDRSHGVWVLRAEVRSIDARSHLAMSLRYDGRLWGPALGAILQQEIERSRARLLVLVDSADTNS
jgi:hypothetical protein